MMEYLQLDSEVFLEEIKYFVSVLLLNLVQFHVVGTLCIFGLSIANLVVLQHPLYLFLHKVYQRLVMEGSYAFRNVVVL